jgi:hypothetical protein
MTDLLDLYKSTQVRMCADLATARANTHAPTSGEAAEKAWRKFLRAHLPHRYAVDKAFVIDSYGNASEQTDIVVYDRQYTPRILDYDGVIWLPAESVYAVLEVKSALNAENLDYAAKKAASVRRLTRTSLPIKHAGGEFPAVALPPILAGILADDSGWTTPIAERLPPLLEPLTFEARIDLGCCANSAGFDVRYEGGPVVEASSVDLGLVYFLVKFVGRLQALGTVPAIDFTRYIAPLENDD